MVVAGALALAFSAGGARAAVFPVNSNADVGDASTADGVCATAGGVCTLRAAIQQANALAGPDAVTLPTDNYALAPGPSGEDAAASGDLDITQDLTITGSGAAATTIDGAGVDRVLHVLGAPAPSVTVSEVTVSGGDGKGDDGGGIRIDAGALTVTNSTVTGNTASTAGDDGGGFENRATLTVVDSTVAGNEAKDDGGGISSRVNLTLVRSTVSGNTAASGTGPGDAAGINNLGNANITNSTISGNIAEDDGGGIYNDGTITISNSTISSNQAESGGGVRFVDSPGINSANLKNTIVSSNTATLGVNCSGPAAAITSDGHNLESNDTCDFNAPGDLKNTEPMLDPLADNGGPTKTRSLQSGSPAIDAGDNTGCPATDQRSVVRPQQSTCDIGAFEYQPTPPASAVPDKTAAILSALKFRPAAFAALGRGPSVIARKKVRGSRVSYSLSEDATVTFSVERARNGRKKKGKKCSPRNKTGKRCTTYKKVKGSFTHVGRSGANSFRFSGRVAGKKLRSGRYRLVAVPTDKAGNRGKVVRKAFRIRRQ